MADVRVQTETDQVLDESSGFERIELRQASNGRLTAWFRGYLLPVGYLKFEQYGGDGFAYIHAGAPARAFTFGSPVSKAELGAARAGMPSDLAAQI